MARLPQTLRYPSSGESLYGFIRRLAEINGITLSSVIKLAGIGRMNPVSPTRLWTNLAEAAGTTIEALDPMRRHPANLPTSPGALIFMGHALRPSHLARDAMKVCPECIRLGGTVRDAWAISQIVSCAKHECLLVDKCTCGRKLNFSLAGPDYPWACVCGKELADLSVTPASEATLATARLLYPIIGRTDVTGYVSLSKKPDKLIPPFDKLGLNDLLAIMDLIGSSATTPVEEDELADHTYLPYGIIGPSGSIDDFIRRNEAAISVMRNWPEAWHDTLDELADRSPPNASSLEDRAILATRAGRRCLAPDRGLDGVPLQLIARETSQWLAERKGVVRRKRHRTSESAKARMLARTMNATIVARLLGVNAYIADFRRIYEETLDALEAEGHVQPAKYLGDVLLERVKSKWEAFQHTVSGIDASAIIEGLAGTRALTGWDHPSLIPPAEEFAGLGRKRKNTYRVKDLEAVLERLEGVSEKVEHVDGLERVTTGITRHALSPHYGKTALLLDIMSGRLPTYRLVSSPKLCDLFADLAVANRIGVTHRAIALDVADAMVQARPLNNMISVLWGKDHRLGVKEARELRQSKRIRFQETVLWNATEQRNHPHYAYSVRDTLRHYLATLGPSGVDRLDEHLVRSV